MSCWKTCWSISASLYASLQPCFCAPGLERRPGRSRFLFSLSVTLDLMCGCSCVILAFILGLPYSYDGQLPEDNCDTTGQCEVSLRQLRGVKLQQDIDMRSDNASADEAMRADTGRDDLGCVFQGHQHDGWSHREGDPKRTDLSSVSSLDARGVAVRFHRQARGRKRPGMDAYGAKNKTDACLAAVLLLSW
eukprot:s189_g16.t1